jgi:hypothetical protein
MILVQGQVGGLSLIGPPYVRLLETVDLGRPVTRYCKALLRGFALANYPTDRRLQDMRVQLHCAFGDDLQHVDVIAEITLADAQGHGQGAANLDEWRPIKLSVYYSIVGE